MARYITALGTFISISFRVVLSIIQSRCSADISLRYLNRVQEVNEKLSFVINGPHYYRQTSNLHCVYKSPIKISRIKKPNAIFVKNVQQERDDIKMERQLLSLLVSDTQFGRQEIYATDFDGALIVWKIIHRFLSYMQ